MHFFRAREKNTELQPETEFEFPAPMEEAEHGWHASVTPAWVWVKRGRSQELASQPASLKWFRERLSQGSKSGEQRRRYPRSRFGLCMHTWEQTGTHTIIPQFPKLQIVFM